MSDTSFSVHSIGGDGAVQLAADSSVLAIFYKGKVQDGHASREAGVAVFKDVDMVEIRQLGERDTTHQVVTAEHKMRWPLRWQQYQQNIEQSAVGTPLEMLFPASPATVATLKAQAITTIQQLANLSDGVISGLQFGLDMRTKARDYIGTVEKGKEYHELENKLEAAQQKNSELEDRLKSLEAAMAKKTKGGQPSENE